MSREKYKVLSNAKLWKIWVPLGIVAITLIFGALSGLGGNTKAAAWNSMGHLIGETTFEPMSGYVSSSWQTFCFHLSRVLGLFLLPYAFYLLVHEQYRDSWARRRIKRWVRHVSGKKDYVLVCGLGWKGYELAKNILTNTSVKVVGIDLQDSDDQVKELCRLGMVFFKGDATAKEVLKKAGLPSASTLYVMTGDDELNCRIAMQAAEICLAEKAPSLACYVSVENGLKRAFLEEFSRNNSDGIAIHCFDLNEQSARLLLNEQGLVSKERGRTEHVHCVVVGDTPVARAVLLQCLRMLHLTQDQRRVITVLCENPEEREREFYRRYSSLGPAKNSLAMERAKEGVFPKVRFAGMPVSSSQWLHDEFAMSDYARSGWRTNLYMCVDSGIQSLALMKLIHPQLTGLAKKDCVIEAACYLNYPETGGSLSQTLWQEFGDYQQCCTAENIKSAASDPLAVEVFSLFKASEEWLKEPSWSRASSRQAADHIYVKLAIAGLDQSSSADAIGAVFDPKEDASVFLTELSEIEHRRWCAERLLDGWLPLVDTEDRALWVQDWVDEAVAKQDAKAAGRKSEFVKTQQARIKNDMHRHLDLVSFDDLPKIETVNGLQDEQLKDEYIIRKYPVMLAQLPKGNVT